MDLKNLSYRKKNQYLAIGSLVFFVLIYMLAFSKTIALHQANSTIQKNLLKAEEAPEQVLALQKKLKQLNQRFSVYLSDTLNSQDEILALVSGFCQKNSLTLNELPLTSITEEEDFIVETNKTIAEGEFVNLLKLLYELEYKSRIARISSAAFNAYFDNKRKKTVLTLTIYLQNIKIKNKNL